MCSCVFIHIAGCTFIFNIVMRRQILKATSCQTAGMGGAAFMRSFVFIHIAGCTFTFNIPTHRPAPKATSCQIEGGGERRTGPGVHNQIVTLAQQ